MSSCTSANPPAKLSTVPSSVKRTSQHSQLLADRIASCALDHYHTQLTRKAKPKPGKEWTVFAAIVAFHREDNRMWVISSATGTKCTAQRHEEFILHDSHAEVLARRGFIRIISSEILKKNSGNVVDNDRRSNSLLTESTICGNQYSYSTGVEATSKERKYQLDPSIGIHLYISDSPCGDASIYSIPSTSSSGGTAKNDISNEILYTGAKVIVSEATKVDATDCGGVHQLLPKENTTSNRGKEENNIIETSTNGPIVAREEIQTLGKLRTKSGRSNLPAHMRSHSHSCSDKIVLWSVLGLQGGMLTKFLNPPVIPLTSVAVSIDSRLLTKDDTNHVEVEKQHYQQQIALERAIPNRVRSVWNSLGIEQHENLPSWKPPVPSVYIVRRVFESGKAAMICTSKTASISGQKRKHFDSFEDCKGSGENREKGDCDKNMNATKTQKIPACGMAFNWNQDEGIEVLVGARGMKHGKKPKRSEDIEKLASRLSRAKLIQLFSSLGDWKPTTNNTAEEKLFCNIPKSSQIAPLSSPNLNGKVYRQLKECTARSDWNNLKSRILTQNGSPLAGWLRCIQADSNFPNDKHDGSKE